MNLRHNLSMTTINISKSSGKRKVIYRDNIKLELAVIYQMIQKEINSASTKT